MLLDVLAAVPFGIGQSEQTLLEDRITPIPQPEAETQPLMAVAKTGDPVFSPAIGAAARMIMREVVPGCAVFTVILANSAPLALADIGPPAPPRCTEPD